MQEEFIKWKILNEYQIDEVQHLRKNTKLIFIFYKTNQKTFSAHFDLEFLNSKTNTFLHVFRLNIFK